MKVLVLEVDHHDHQVLQLSGMIRLMLALIEDRLLLSA